MNRKSIVGLILTLLLTIHLPLCAYAQGEESQTGRNVIATEESLLEGETDNTLAEEKTDTIQTDEIEYSVTTEELTSEDDENPEDATLDEEPDNNPEIQAQANTSVAIYRLYYPANGEHLYTSDVNEKNTLYNKYGWGYEGIAWYASNSGRAVYRLYHPGLGNHLYTTDTNEVKTLTSRYGWKKDNDGKALFYSSGDVPIYRVYNKNQSGMHHLTTDVNEYNTLPRYGWMKEGVKIYAQKIGSPITTTYNLANVKKAYRTIVNQNKGSYGGSFLTYYYNSYHLHDLNCDGIPELILKVGWAEANYMGVVYTYDMIKQKAIQIGTFGYGHSALYYGNANRSSGPLIEEWVHMDWYIKYEISYNNNTFKWTKLFEKNIPVSELPPNYGLLPTYSTKNLSPLY